MALEHLFSDLKIIRVLDTFVVNQGFTLSIHDLVEDCNTTTSKIQLILKKLQEYDLIQKHDEEGEYFYSLDTSNELTKRLVEFTDEVNLFQYNKEQHTKGKWNRCHKNHYSLP